LRHVLTQLSRNKNRRGERQSTRTVTKSRRLGLIMLADVLHGIARVVWHLPKIKDRLKAVSSLHKDKEVARYSRQQNRRHLGRPKKDKN